MSTFWTIWISVITLGSVIGCFFLLRWTIKDRQGVEEGKSMGHSFDGSEELNTDIPRWWSSLLMFTILAGLAYCLLFPGLGGWQGLLGWTQKDQYEQELARADETYGKVFREIVYKDNGEYHPIEQLAQNQKAVQIGQRLFLQNCSQCHGSDARGARGYPNLTDGDWLWGGEPAQIKTTILHGRQAAMPGWLETLGEDGIKNMAAYTLSLSGRKVDMMQAKEGEKQFVLCAACHGPEGKGNPALGAPNLTDNIWLYGGSRAAVEETLRYGRNGVMPAFGDILGEDKIHLISAYVYRLSNN